MNTTDTAAREALIAAKEWLTESNSPRALREQIAAALSTTPQTDGATARLIDEQRQKVRDAIAEALGDAYDCTRVWSAWGYGTMSQDDFSMVAEDDDRLEEITDAAINALAATHAPAMAETQLTADDADMVWADDDGESMFHCIDDAVDCVVDLNWPDAEPVEVTFQLGKRIPNASIRIFNITENGHEWQIVPTGAAASGGEQAS